MGEVHETIGVAVVDDHLMVAEMLSLLIASQQDMRLVGVAHGVGEAIALVGDERPDVVLMDFTLPDGDGISAVRTIIDRWPSTHVVMLSGTDTDDLLERAIEVGCVGYLVKDRPVDDVLRAIRGAARGQLLFSASELSRLLGRLRKPSSPSVEWLTARELEVLRLLAKGHSTEGIASQLFISVNTVRNHVGRILNKLGAHSKLEAVAIAARDKLVNLND
ncbi:MAG: response regulator [Acidimicrobiales bacterium]